jgi:hypothetical protein
MLWWLVQGLLVLNLLDGVLTLIWVRTGIAVEANPLLADLVQANGMAFMAVKLAFVSACVLVLWRLRTRKLAVAGLVLSFGVYSTLFLYHLGIAALAVQGLV